MRQLRSVATLLLLLVAGCGPSSGANSGDRTPLAEKWMKRAETSFRTGDIEDAKTSVESALQAAPKDNEVRLLAGRIALSRLDYTGAIKLTEDLKSTEAYGIRGRAHWYAGNLEEAADELEAMLQDPQVKDPWAKEISKLARRGHGRHPFAVEGARLGAVDMPPAGPMMVVPCELEGEQILALISTGIGEVVVDSATRKEAAWVNLKFGGVEVKDVPAVPQDLSPLSRQLGAPIKAMLGVNLLRRTHATFDRRGSQFVVRQQEPVAPPDATRVPMAYLRGGAMVTRVSVSNKEDSTGLLLVDSAAVFPLALEDSMWKKTGVDLSTLRSDPNLPAPMKAASVPLVRIAGFELPQIPAVQGAPMSDLKNSLDVEIGGVVGAGLMSIFRVTFGDEGRFVWLEPDPSLAGPPPGAASNGPPPPAKPEPKAAPAPAAKPGAKK